MKEFWELPTTYLNCDCQSHLLKLVYEEEEFEEAWRFLYISFFNEGHGGHEENFWRRLKLIWYTLRHGTPWADMVCLRTNEIVKLKEYLNGLNLEIKQKGEVPKRKIKKEMKFTVQVPEPPPTRKINEDIHSINFIKNLFKEEK